MSVTFALRFAKVSGGILAPTAQPDLQSV